MSLIAYANGILLADRIAATELSQTQKVEMTKIYLHEKGSFAMAYCGRRIYSDELKTLMTKLHIITTINSARDEKVLELFGFFDKRYLEERIFLLMTRDRVFMSYKDQGFIMVEQKEPVYEGTLGDAFLVALTSGLGVVKAAKETALLAYGHDSTIDYIRQSSLKRIPMEKKQEIEKLLQEEGL